MTMPDIATRNLVHAVDKLGRERAMANYFSGGELHERGLYALEAEYEKIMEARTDLTPQQKHELYMYLRLM